MKQASVIALVSFWTIFSGPAACGGAGSDRPPSANVHSQPPSSVYPILRDPGGAWTISEIPPFQIAGDSRFPILVSDSRSWRIEHEKVLDTFRDTALVWAGVGQARLMRMADGPDGTRYTGNIISLETFPHPSLRAWKLRIEEIAEFWGNGPMVVETAPLGPIYILEIPGDPGPSLLFFVPVESAIDDTDVHSMGIDSVVASVRVAR